MLVRVPREQFTPRKHLLLACGCLRCIAEHNLDPFAGYGPEFFFPASNLSDWLTGAEGAADGNPSRIDEYASGIPGQKATSWLPGEALARVVRDLFVCPLVPVPFRDEWLTTTVLALAKTIDAEGSFEALPVLGDALEDAGCTDEDVLRHCRHESCHFRGCWVLDLILSKDR
jgi:hypothetical protein